MNFLLCGDKNAPPVLLIHGMATDAESCYGTIARKLAKRYRVIMACLDGHDPYQISTFESISVCCEKIERYIGKRFGGSVYAVSGFSLGGNVALELMKRGVIKTRCLHLDAAVCAGVGIMKTPLTLYYTKGADMRSKGIKMPKIVTELLLGRGSLKNAEEFSKDVTSSSLGAACRDVFGYTLSPRLTGCRVPVQYWFGSTEKYAIKSARSLEEYLPGIKVRVFRGLGHGQLLREHEGAYFRELKKFLDSPGEQLRPAGS